MTDLIIGIKGTVLAIYCATGVEKWTTHLHGKGFVHVLLDGGRLFAATHGMVFRLDPGSGEIRWKNELKGMGFGLITIAQATDGNRSVLEEKQRRDEEAASADAGTALFEDELLFFGHHYGNFRGDVFVQPHRHFELAQTLDGVVQLNLAPVHGEAFGGQPVSYVLRSDGAE